MAAVGVHPELFMRACGGNHVVILVFDFKNYVIRILGITGALRTTLTRAM